MMTVYREYSQSEDISHIEEVPAQEARRYAEKRGATDWRIAFRPAGEFLDWHPANRKSLLVVLQGTFEIGASDGTQAILKPGDICFFNDYGKGHTGRVVGDAPCVTMHMGLPPDA
jgi:uncharacterized cupin superfamily protein